MVKQKYGVVIYCHPYNGSFSNAIKDAAIKGFKKKNIKVELIDLVADKFNPIGKNLNDNKTITQIKKYQDLILGADDLVITYPIWWSGKPALMKGFFDTVLWDEKFFKVVNGKMQPVSNIFNNAFVFTTSFTPNMVTKFLLRSPNRKRAIGAFGSLGFKNINFYNLDKVKDSLERRERFLLKVTNIVGGSNA